MDQRTDRSTTTSTAADDIVTHVPTAASHEHWDAVRSHLQSIRNNTDALEHEVTVRLVDVTVQHGNARLLHELLTSSLYDALQNDVSASCTPHRLLHRIVCEGNADMLAALLATARVSLSHCPSDALSEANERSTCVAPLLLAAEQDNEPVIRVLPEHGADPNATAAYASEWTALHLAAEWGTAASSRSCSAQEPTQTREPATATRRST